MERSWRTYSKHSQTILWVCLGGWGWGYAKSQVAVDRFLKILNVDYKVPATVRVRRGIDIDAGCGQLKSKVMAQEKEGEGGGGGP